MNKEIYREFNKGWNFLFDELLKKLEPFNVKITQAKEKHGALNVYIHSENIDDYEKAFNITEEYYEKSKTICEMCSAEGSVENIGGWMKTLCSHCLESIKKR